MSRTQGVELSQSQTCKSSATDVIKARKIKLSEQIHARLTLLQQVPRLHIGELVVLPEFNERGDLPAGIHLASLDELEARFGRSSEVRQVQMESLRWLVELARKAGVRRLIINGSFVTERLEPNDVDCALLTGPDFPRDRIAEKEILAGLPFLQIALIGQEDFDYMVDTVFATDRQLIPKGVVEVML